MGTEPHRNAHAMGVKEVSRDTKNFGVHVYVKHCTISVSNDPFTPALPKRVINH